MNTTSVYYNANQPESSRSHLIMHRTIGPMDY